MRPQAERVPTTGRGASALAQGPSGVDLAGCFAQETADVLACLRDKIRIYNLERLALSRRSNLGAALTGRLQIHLASSVGSSATPEPSSTPE